MLKLAVKFLYAVETALQQAAATFLSSSYSNKNIQDIKREEEKKT